MSEFRLRLLLAWNREQSGRLEGAIATFSPFKYKFLLYCYRYTINKCLLIVHSIVVY